MKVFVKLFGGLYTPVSKFIHERWVLLFPKWYASYFYKKVTNKKLDLNNPQNLQEKIQWLKIYSDTSQWTDLADKYKVRDYINQCGLSDILVKLYGVWERAEDIDFSKLPEKFVLKTNHGFKKVILVEDKSKLDKSKTKRQLNRWVKEKYGLVSFEPHYWNIERRIIAEEFLEDNYNMNISSSLVDYKFYCINGEPEVILCMYDRENTTLGSNLEKDFSGLKKNLFDLDWNPRPEFLSDGYGINMNNDIPKPNRLDEMKRICKILANPFPFVRVDLYEVNDKVYFGEMTFTPGGNFQSFSGEYALEMGKKINLSMIKRKKKRSII